PADPPWAGRVKVRRPCLIPARAGAGAYVVPREKCIAHHPPASRTRPARDLQWWARFARRRDDMPHERFQSCIDACVQCAEACEHCADACLHEEDVTALADCVRLDRDCAEVCWLAAAFMC